MIREHPPPWMTGSRIERSDPTSKSWSARQKGVVEMKRTLIMIAAFAVVLGLGGLGGYAMSQNRASTPKASSDAATGTQVIRRTVHLKPKHKANGAGSAGAGSPLAASSGSLTSQPISTGSSGASSSAPSTSPVRTGSSGGGGGGGGEREHEGGGDD